jgi:hypothetical protein
VVVHERGLAVPLDLLRVPPHLCPVCCGTLLSPAAAADAEAGEHAACSVLAPLLQPLEHALLRAYCASAGVTADPATRDADFGLEVAALWARIAAVASLPGSARALETPEHGQAARSLVSEWRDALAGLCLQDTWSSSDAWLTAVTIAAATFWEGVPGAQRSALQDLLVPLVALSPAGAIAQQGPVETLVVLAGQMNRNGYSVRAAAQPNRVVALGIFPAIALLNHSCQPNCTVLSQADGTLEVRTISAIPADAELLVSYVDLLQAAESRQAQLFRAKGFACRCLRCHDSSVFPLEHHFNGLTCPRCQRCVLRAWNTGWVCRQEDGGCGALHQANAIAAAAAAAVKALEDAVVNLQHSKSTPADAAAQLAQLLTATVPSRLPDLHAMAQKVRTSLFRHLAPSAPQGAAGHLERLVSVLARVLPALWPELHELQLMVAEAYRGCDGSEPDTLARSLVWAKKAKAGLEVLCPEGHPLRLRAERLVALNSGPESPPPG